MSGRLFKDVKINTFSADEREYFKEDMKLLYEKDCKDCMTDKTRIIEYVKSAL